MTPKEKCDYLIELMGYCLAKRYVEAKIVHWENDEFIIVRDETKEFWEEVLNWIVPPFKSS